MADGESGKFSTDISQDLINQALRSVERATGETAEPPEPAAPPQDPKDRELEELKAQLELSQAKGREMMERVKDAHEKMLRAVADLENYRKRAAKEKEELQKFGVEKLLRDLLPIMDNLDRAIEHSRTAPDLESLRQGVEMTRKLFEDTLGHHGVRSFTSVGKPFDPRFHEAMQQVETSEVPPNQVVTEIVRGFTLNDRLVRPALVMVAKAPAAASGVQGGEGQGSEEGPGGSDASG